MQESRRTTEIRPFRGWRYAGDVTGRIAPPYDILDSAGKTALLSGNPDNIVSVDLPHVPPVGVGPQDVYDAAAAKLAELQSSGTLVQDDGPALYAYSQTYAWGDRQFTRRAMICGVRATELCEGVWPHEQTFAGPKADRLKLTEATRLQMSSIFGFFDDSAGAGDALWEAVGSTAPTVAGELNGVTEKLWAITDPDVIARVADAMADSPIFIADGHHRYTTALNYRNALREAGEIDDDHEANFVLFTLVAMDDPGLLVLPTHRLIGGITDGFDCEALVAETAETVVWEKADITDQLWEDPDAFLAPFGPGAIAFVDGDLAAAYVGRLAKPETMVEQAPDECDTWRGLDVAILHTFFLDAHILPHVSVTQHLGYTAKGDQVHDALTSGACQMAAILPGTPLAAVRDIALAKAVMPHKSTYFFPKLATGMVLKPLE